MVLLTLRVLMRKQTRLIFILTSILRTRELLWRRVCLLHILLALTPSFWGTLTITFLQTPILHPRILYPNGIFCGSTRFSAAFLTSLLGLQLSGWYLSLWLLCLTCTNPIVVDLLSVGCTKCWYGHLLGILCCLLTWDINQLKLLLYCWDNWLQLHSLDCFWLSVLLLGLTNIWRNSKIPKLLVYWLTHALIKFK